MEGNQQSFCTHCGQNLREGDLFCPACGTRVPTADPHMAEAEKAQVREGIQRQLRWAAMLMLVYSIPFLILGIYVLVDMNSLVDALMGNPQFVEYSGFTREEVVVYFQYAGFMYIVSSLCGIGSAVLCWKGTKFWFAVILCIMSIIIGGAGFLAIFMGLFAFWMILSGKLGFEEYSEKLEQALEQI